MSLHSLHLLQLLSLVLLLLSCPASATNAKTPSKVGSSRSTACNRPTELLVATDWGVVGDGVHDDTAAMRRLLATPCTRATQLVGSTNANVQKDNAVADCPCHTHVVIPEGATVLTLPLNLTSHTTLQVDGTLLAAPSTAHWPIMLPNPINGDSEDSGMIINQYQSFLYAGDATHIRVTGSGVIDGNGPYWWDLFHNHSHALTIAGRPNLFQTNNCTGIEIDGVTMKDAAFWTLHPMLSRDIYIHHMKIRAPMYAPNVDGIDPDSCQNVMVEYNDVACGDDHISIKSGVCGLKGTKYHNNCMDPDYQARQASYLTRNVTIRHNIFRTGMGVAIGSATSGSIRDIFIYNNTIGLCEAGHDDEYRSCGWGPALHIKTTITRSGTIENVIFDNNTIYNTSMFIFLETNYQIKHQDLPANYPKTVVKNIFFQNNRALGEALGATFHCDALDPCHEVHVLNNTIVKAAKNQQNPWSCQFIDSYQVAGNVPDGLEDCMAQSMNKTNRMEEAYLEPKAA